jgi:hypothetical protein
MLQHVRDIFLSFFYIWHIKCFFGRKLGYEHKMFGCTREFLFHIFWHFNRKIPHFFIIYRVIYTYKAITQNYTSLFSCILWCYCNTGEVVGGAGEGMLLEHLHWHAHSDPIAMWRFGIVFGPQ